jgi:hypothetical protein
VSADAPDEGEIPVPQDVIQRWPQGFGALDLREVCTQNQGSSFLF